MRMIEDGKGKKFDLIVAKEVSRFSRDTIDSLLYTRKLLKYDVCVYFLSDNIITASNNGELRLTIVLETDNVLGYKKEKGKLVIDEEEAPLVRAIFSIYANNLKIGLKKLSATLQEQGYCNCNGNAIHQNTLKNIIQNPKYKGYYTGGLSAVVDYRSKKRNFNNLTDWKVFKDYDKVPLIVSEELWEKANPKLWQRSKSAKGDCKYQNKYALSGKLYCQKHQCGFVRKVRYYKDKEDTVFWYCKDFYNTGKKNCISACFKEDLYSILLSTFQTYEIYKEEICRELLSFYLEQSKVEECMQQEIRLQNELANLQRKK